MLAVPLLLAAGGSYVWLTGGRYQETENANLRQARVTIASEAAGRIVEVDIADNAEVKAGDTLFVVDPEPYRIALSQADAALAAARLNVEQLRAAYGQAVAQERVAQARSPISSRSSTAPPTLPRRASARSRRWTRRSATSSAPRSSTGPRLQGIESARAALGGDPEIVDRQAPERARRAVDARQGRLRSRADHGARAGRRRRSARRPRSRSDSTSPRARRCSASSRPATPGSRRTSRKRSSPT